MKKLFQSALLLIGFTAVMVSCNNKDASAPANTVSAQVGANQFNSTGNNVVVTLLANPADNSKTELTITSAMGNQVLTLAVADYNASSGTGTYTFDGLQALGAYYDGVSSSGDDVIVSGSIVITQAGGTITGTFSGTTAGGTAITSGTFSVVQ